MIETKAEQGKALLVGVNLADGNDFMRSMQELKALSEACELKVVGQVEQNLAKPTQALFLGSGKVQEVREMVWKTGADMVIFDNALSPMQLRNLQEEIGIAVLDRTALILDIFALRARSREAKLQVEVAKLQYMLPRLAGLHAALSRQGGSGGGGSQGGSGFANKGAGETKIELDRRHIEHRLAELRRELKVVEKERLTQRKQRMSSNIKRVALVGYTNAGKSTLMNAFVEQNGKDLQNKEQLEEKKVFEKDMLFATLDTTVRKIRWNNKKEILLSDTVGFIDKLPHNLVDAFRSTLEEAKEADLLLQVVDCSDPNYKDQVRITNETLKELGAADIPMIYVMNKAEQVFTTDSEWKETTEQTVNLVSAMGETTVERKIGKLPIVLSDRIFMSAKNKIGIEELTELISKKLFADHITCKMLIPYQDGAVVSYLNEKATIEDIEYLAEGTGITVTLSESDYQKYQKYVISESE